MKIETLPIGDELLTGKIADTNSQWVADHLFELGARLERATVIADNPKVIKNTLHETASRADLTIVFGGLGPTSDDKTAECVSELLGVKLVEDEASKTRLFAYLKARGRDVTPQALKQIVYPEGTTPIPNFKGSAVGFSLILEGCRFYFLPGVPFEMKAMFLDFVLPQIKKFLETSEKLLHQTWRCHEIPEAELQRLMVPIESSLPKHAYLGYRTRYPENFLTLYWKSDSLERSPEMLHFQEKISGLVKDFCYSQDNIELEELIFQKLKTQGKTLAVAESCTGGKVSELLTRVPGVSEVFFGGVTVYQNAAKEKLLGVTLERPSDAVSAACTLQLAQKVKEKSGASIGAAITGYLGPSGGTEADPVGTLYLSVVGEKTFEKRVVLPARDRNIAKNIAANFLLAEINKSLGQ